jgi:translocation and assembly module TamB
MRRPAKTLAWCAGAAILLVVVLGAALLVLGNTDAGRGMIEALTARLTGGTVQLTGLGGAFPSRLTLVRLDLVDRQGVWLTADQVAVTWSPLRLLQERIDVDDLRAARIHMERTPVGDGHGGSVSFPLIEIGHATLPVVELGAPLVGEPASLSMQGNLRLRSLDDADADILAGRLNGTGDYSLHLHLDPRRLDGALVVHEPAAGPLENLLGVPGLGTLAANVAVRGPRRAAAVDLVLAAGDLHAKVKGTIDLVHSSADLNYSLHATAMAPRADLGWSGIALDGDWHGAWSAPHASGRLQIERLSVAGSTRIAKLGASLAADGGKLKVDAVLQGLEIPGREPQFLARDALKIDASLELDARLRPLELIVSHPLFSMRGQFTTVPDRAGQWSGAAELKIPDLAPFAVFTGQDVRGSAVINGHFTHRADRDAATLDANLGLSGGTAAWVAVAGPHVSGEISGSLTDSTLKVDSMRIAAHALTLTASGSAARAAPGAPASTPDGGGFLERFARQVQASWQVDAADLAALSPDLAGDLKLAGSLGGSPGSMSGAAELTSHMSVRGSPEGFVKASLHAHGLPATPSGTLEARGMLDGSPLRLDAALERSGPRAFRVTVREAGWKSAHAEGDLSADAQLTQSHGRISLGIAQLGDFDRLLGMSLGGSIEGGLRIVPAHGRTEAELSLDGKSLVVGRFAGNVHLQGSGLPDAFGLQLTAESPNVAGLPASLTAAADLDLASRTLRLASAALTYHDQIVKLQAPAELSFAQGFAVDALQIGVQDAVLELRGRALPVLDLHASLRQVTPGLVNVFAPGLLAAGLVEAHVDLEGTPERPTGRVRLDATDIRFADDAATGLPPLALHAGAQLNGSDATVSARLDAGAASQLTASGTAPENANGLFDLKIGGTLDVGLANPFLEARGMHASGALTADVSVTGGFTDPEVGGGIVLSRGSLRDYGRGLSLNDISADIGGGAGGLQIKSSSAKAGSGSIAMSGTVGLLQPGLPLDLKISAKNAQPITSNILTANLNADVRVSGTARQRLDVVGTIAVNRATIGIPDSLPPEVAVLDVRRRGRRAQATESALVIGMEIDIKAPRQILVEGRGLDAEMGGEIHLTGTTDAPLASGGLELRRGSFAIAGNKLTFSPDSKIGFDGAGLEKKIDPTLDFTAETTIGTTTATLHISGVADAPRFDFTSTPELPPDQIMALLLFGQPAAQLSALQIAEVGYALATLSGVGGGGNNPLIKLQKSLGLDRLTVGTNTVTTATGATENSGAAIAAGRYITNRVYVEGKQTNTGTSQVQVDVDLTKRLKLQTRLGNGTATIQGTTPENDPGSSIGLLYQFEY